MNPSFAQVRDEYRELFHAAKVDPGRKALIDGVVAQAAAHQHRYEAIGEPLRVPWWFIAIVHELECSLNFNEHLHNGDPLSHKTVHDPAGRPPGRPPFTFEQSARDALTFQGFTHQHDWSVSHTLYRFETYNGFGYRPRGIHSPYLWSFSNHYTRGKFIKDNVFDANAVSQQIGAAVMLRVMIDEGHATALSSTAVVA